MIGTGNGTPGPISGQIWQMSATHVHCSSIVVVSWAAGAIVSTIELDSDAAHSANVKGAAQTMTTRQSEMANTSPCHIPVLGDVRKCWLFFSWRHFSARSSFYIFNWYSYRRSKKKEIVGQVFEIYTIELLGSLPTDEAWPHALTLHYICIRSTLTYREYVYNSL